MATAYEDRKAGLLAYCRIDAPDDTEDALLKTCYAAAVGYMTSAGVAEPEAGTDRRGQYDLCVNYMVLDSYDRRDRTITGTIVASNPVFRQLMVQLKLTEPDPVVETEETV